MKLPNHAQILLCVALVQCLASSAERAPSQPAAKRQALDSGTSISNPAPKPMRAPQADLSAPSDAELEAAIADELSDRPAAAPKVVPQTPPQNSPAALPPQGLGSFSESPPPQVADPVQQDEAILGFQQPMSLAESFSAEKNPGKGTLTYKFVDQNEVIDLGGDSGQYGFGLVFRHQTLPPEFVREYGTIDVIQFSFGTLPSRLQGRVPEFSTMAVFTKSKPKQWKSFPILVGVQKLPGQEFGVLLFTSSKASSTRSDEEKLRDTFFSKSGQIRIMTSGPAKGLDVDAQGKKVAFKVQAMKLEVESELSTPFNAQKHNLSGAVEIPVYWPESPAALSWMKKIALQSLLASNTAANRNAASTEGGAPKKAPQPRKSSGKNR